MEWVRRISMADLDSRFGNEWVRRISMAECEKNLDVKVGRKGSFLLVVDSLRLEGPNVPAIGT
jgi:hypothetical protein